MRPPVGAPTLNRRTRILLIAAGVLVLLLLGGSRLITLYVDWLWFGEVGYRNVFTTIIFTRILQFLLGAVLIGGRSPSRCGSPTGSARSSSPSRAPKTRSPGTAP
jgi:uncharacterized membrane protein (UPF0182 family)